MRIDPFGQWRRGLAAIELARRAGAKIFATAGTEEKREFLKTLGIEHVMDSRSLAFTDAVLERTGGRGVDVILNSLAGQAIPRGMEASAEHGRFLEIGKRTSTRICGSGCVLSERISRSSASTWIR